MGLEAVLVKQKDLMVYPEFKDEAVKHALIDEARTFISNVVFDGDASFSTLLMADYTYANQLVAPIYGKTSAGMAKIGFVDTL